MKCTDLLIVITHSETSQWVKSQILEESKESPNIRRESRMQLVYLMNNTVFPTQIISSWQKNANVKVA